VTAVTRILLIVIIIMSLAGMVDAGYAARLHYDAGDDSFCNFGPQFNCDVVNTSKYAAILGVPVAGIGFAGYLLFAALSVSLLKGFDLRGLASPALVAAAALGTGFSLYLTYVEFFILETVCILCVISQALVILILAAAIAVTVLSRRAGGARV